MPPQPMGGSRAVWNGLLGLLFALGVLAALGVAIPRILVESQNRNVEVIVDASTVDALATQTGVTSNALLARLRAHGVSAVAISETTIQDAVAAGWVSLIRPEELQPALFESVPPWLTSATAPSEPHAAISKPPSVYVAWNSVNMPDWLNEALHIRMQSVGSLAFTQGTTVFWEVPGRSPSHPATAVLAMGLGFPPDALAGVAQHGMRIALRPLDFPTLTPPEVIARVQALGPYAAHQTLFIFDGASLPADPALRSDWHGAINSVGGNVAWIEFAFQRGVPQLIESLDYAAIRLHSIATPELHKLSVERGVARWVRAVKERGVRALYVRLYTEVPPGWTGPPDLLVVNDAYVTRLMGALHAEGYVAGKPEPLRLPTVPGVSVLAMFSAIAVSCIWLLRRFIYLRSTLEAALLMSSVMLFVSLAPEMSRQAAALLAAIVFPVLGTLLGLDKQASVPSHPPLLAAIRALLKATAVSMLGSLLLVGLLSETRFALGLSLFVGVKAMHVVPPLCVAFLSIWGGAVPNMRGIRGRIAELLSERIPLGYVVAVGVVGLVALLVVLRTGTDILPVPGLETRFRESLEVWLGVRPRNKEFLLGHPVFVLTAFLVWRKQISGVWLATFAAVSSIGQLSLVNTFAHIHSPVLLGFQRTAFGLVLGCVLGVFLSLLYKGTFDRVKGHRAMQGNNPPCV